MPPVAQPEVSALLACGTAPSQAAERVVSALSGVVDWALLVDLADATGMLPLLSLALSQRLPPTLPPAVLAEIRARAASKAMRTLSMAGELARILRSFEAAGLTPIAFKGPLLSHLLYGNLALRDSTDLDIFVPRRQLASALQILTHDGYHKKTPGWNTWLPGACEVALQRQNPLSEVDLHWQFSPPYFIPPDPARALQRSIVVQTHGLTARTLCPEDLLLYLSIHAAREGWPLRSVCDIAALTRTGSLNWDDVLRESQVWKCWRPVAVGLQLAAGLCEASLPSEVRTRVQSDRAAASIAVGLISQLAHVDAITAGSPAGARLHLRMIEGGLAKFRYLWRRTLQPNHLDVDFLPLPQYLAPAYYLVRPFRVAATALGALRPK